ncbi:hypothetical protein NXT08_22585 [Rhodococcus pyridinivorans]|uniref:hypothetical protein n=1 Tax=Rhodococcus pyridinivorans TaxID=103816 RepID=UPI00216452BD|nr:hypothetical protein [Rhodococcus pyridinivorans]UVT24991.1 hypothetical protein NXT08_22585 [Rhodococcus pyridinivorans]
MTTITGTTIKNVANGLSNGDITVESPQARGRAGTFIDTGAKTVDVTDGTFPPIDVEPGPILVTITTEGAHTVFEALVPDSGNVDLWALREQTYSYTEPVISEVAELVQRAEAAADRAEQGGGTGGGGIFLDADGVPYFDTAATGGGSIALDVDGVPYVTGV